MKAGPFIFVCIVCFVAGACLSTLIVICSFRPSRNVLMGWIVYLAVCFALAYSIGGALLL